MGIAKSIEAYSIYENYNSDTDVFIKHLSDRLNADFIINIFDKDYEHIGDENIVTAFNKQYKYRLTITFDEYKIGDDSTELPTYEISIPIKYIYEDCIEFTFCPNQSVHIMFLTFEHLWSSFIETLKFQSAYEDRQQAISRYQALRREYTSILHEFEISQIFITTHAYYEIENVTDFETYNNLTFEKIIEVAQEKDKLAIFDFQHILETTSKIQLDKRFIDKSDLGILLLDTMKPQ